MSALKVKALGRRPRRRMSSNCVHGARTSSHPLLNTTARAPESPASHKLEATTPTTNACDTAPRGKVHHCSEGVCASKAALSMAGHCLSGERGAQGRRRVPAGERTRTRQSAQRRCGCRAAHHAAPAHATPIGTRSMLRLKQTCSNCAERLHQQTNPKGTTLTLRADKIHAGKGNSIQQPE